MEMLNKVELQGIVGSVRIHEVADREHARLSFVTIREYKDSEGNPVMENQWHNVIAWSGECQGIDLATINKGDRLRIKGTIRYTDYINSSGIERTITEIHAYKISRIKA